MLKYKLDIVQKMGELGYNPRKIRTMGILGERTMTSLRRGDMISMSSLDTICRLLQCQPGDLLLWVPDDDCGNNDNNKSNNNT